MAAPQAKSRLISLLDALVHPALRLDSDILNRARVLATALLLLSVQLAVSAAAMMLPGLHTHFHSFSVKTDLAVLAAILTVQALLRGTANYVVPSVAILLTLYLADLAAIYTTGGVAISCCTQSLAEVPLVAYFFGGARWGNRMAVISIASIAAFALLETAGWHFDNALDNAAAGISYLIISVINTILTAGIAFAYVFLARKLERERDLEHKLVVRMARTDALTGLDNRLKFDSDLRARIAAVGPRVPFSLCYLDLDGFKPINDRHGHDVGDEVLRAVSERLLGCMREGDSVARYGGDEFALLLNSVGNEEAMEFTARRLLRAIALPIRTRVGTVSVQGSLGFAVFPLDGGGEDALKSAADKAMYAAKAQGGNWRSFRASVGASPLPPSEQASDLQSGSA
jgi:diguanylate cyclase (GGDEF)-like protein